MSKTQQLLDDPDYLRSQLSDAEARAARFTPNRWHMTKRDLMILKAMLSNLYSFLEDANKKSGTTIVVETIIHLEQVEG